MKKNLTELVFILDASGSMSGLEEDTIGGFNSMIRKQKEENGEAGEVLVTTVTFDSDRKVIHKRVSLKEIGKMTEADYQVGGCTALLDAVGYTIKEINEAQKAMPEDERPEKTMFIITTDGEENSSRHYSVEKVKQMITKKQIKKNWEFLFLGANIDAVQSAARIGIRANRATNYACDSAGTDVNFKALGNAVAKFRKCAAAEAAVALADWDEAIVEDFQSRK